MSNGLIIKTCEPMLSKINVQPISYLSFSEINIASKSETKNFAVIGEATSITSLLTSNWQKIQGRNHSGRHRFATPHTIAI